MLVEPPESVWDFATAVGADPDDDLVAMGADLEPGTLLDAYRHGVFPMPADDPRAGLLWFCPQLRGVLPLEGLVVSRSLRRSRRDFEIRVDTAFADVVAACADSRRVGGWINADFAAAYTRLHELGWAHSVEAWREGRLVGGLYGVAIGGLFAGESMFHRERDASKVALLGLVDLLSDASAGSRLLDVQWQTPHLASLGVVQVRRGGYLRRLDRALRLPLPAAFR
ncbi:leucyl/phenylalanyl-tRNA--protein transferase [Nocardioides sp.]|uniref:leucyl/phenylalanyl-tRNA--protein transferase n=1 Tax=Nocardioides sp. TaxID=35761 RepID=UPI002735DC62|nr:leucyl/phenylalanyl-tRNA--protein transferase [Nocardioides sp.]MDP3891378.1 leucyl/phenylalanyl-tRNA--protein transferase [Nocardioides sp.]